MVSTVSPGRGRFPGMKKIIGVTVVLILVSIVGVFFLQNQKSRQQRKITVALINPNAGSETIEEVFASSLKRYGDKEGWQFEFQRCGNKETFDADLQKLISGQPDLLFTVTTPGTKKTIQASKGKNIPGVFVVFDPVSAGIINELPKPGGNFTGVQLRGSVPKALEWLLTIAPKTQHIFVPVRFDTPAAKMSLADLQKTAKKFGVRVTVAEVGSKKELDAAMETIPEDADAVFLLNSIFISSHAEQIAAAAKRKKLATAASIGKCAEGIMMSYSTRHAQSGLQASRLAYQVLKGEDPGNIPAEIVDFYFCVNLPTIKTIGLDISDSILAQADEIIRQQ